MQYPTQSGQNFPKRNVNFEYREADFPSLDMQGKQIQDLSVSVKQIQSCVEYLMSYTKMNAQQSGVLGNQAQCNNYNSQVNTQQVNPQYAHFQQSNQQQANPTFSQPSFNQVVQRNDAKK